VTLQVPEEHAEEAARILEEAEPEELAEEDLEEMPK
jgi:hypothetical protein